LIHSLSKIEEYKTVKINCKESEKASILTFVQYYLSNYYNTAEQTYPESVAFENNELF